MNPLQSYFHLVVCIVEFMMRYGENNHNVHDVREGYEEYMAPSSDVNDTEGRIKKIHRARTF